MIGTADPHDMPFASIEMTAEQRMPLVPVVHHAPQIYPAILGPCAGMIL